MSCSTARRPFRCPTAAETLTNLLKLLPTGRAWQSHDGGPQPEIEAAFQSDFVQGDAFSVVSRTGSTLWRFWAAAAQVVQFVNERLCALRLEFFCATHVETHDLWMREYGLPDACDPFPDLCTKVAAIGGTRCEYYAAIAARAGWSIECSEDFARCRGARASCAIAGRAKAGAALKSRALLLITVFLNESPSFVGRTHRRPLAGRLLAGQRLACLPDITPLQCLLDRVVHAHLTINYQTR